MGSGSIRYPYVNHFQNAFSDDGAKDQPGNIVASSSSDATFHYPHRIDGLDRGSKRPVTRSLK